MRTGLDKFLLNVALNAVQILQSVPISMCIVTPRELRTVLSFLVLRTEVDIFILDDLFELFVAELHSLDQLFERYFSRWKAILPARSVFLADIPHPHIDLIVEKVVVSFGALKSVDVTGVDGVFSHLEQQFPDVLRGSVIEAGIDACKERCHRLAEFEEPNWTMLFCLLCSHALAQLGMSVAHLDFDSVTESFGFNEFGSSETLLNGGTCGWLLGEREENSRQRTA